MKPNYKTARRDRDNFSVHMKMGEQAACWVGLCVFVVILVYQSSTLR